MQLVEPGLGGSRNKHNQGVAESKLVPLIARHVRKWGDKVLGHGK